MEKKYIFFDSPFALAILFLGVAILFAGVVFMASLFPGNKWANVIFIVVVSIAIVSVAFSFESREKK